MPNHINLLHDSVRRVRRLYPFHIGAWVVLPDHLHCIWTLPPDTDDFPVRWRLTKLLFSKGLRVPSVYPPHGGGEPNGATGNGAIGNIPLLLNGIMFNILTIFTLTHSSMVMLNRFAIGLIQLFIIMFPMAFYLSIGVEIWPIYQVFRNNQTD